MKFEKCRFRDSIFLVCALNFWVFLLSYYCRIAVYKALDKQGQGYTSDIIKAIDQVLSFPIPSDFLVFAASRITQ